MALKVKTGDYIYNEDTNPTRRPLIQWQEGGEEGGTAEPSWQGVPQNEADQASSTNIGIGMAELIYLKIHPLISPGIDAMDDDLPTWQDSGDNNVDQYMTDEWDMIIYDDEGNPVPNPEYTGGMTLEEWNAMNQKSQDDQISAKQFWVDMSMAIAEGVIEHIKLEHNNPLHKVDEGQPSDGDGAGLETDEITQRALYAIKGPIGGIGGGSLAEAMKAQASQSKITAEQVGAFAETVSGNFANTALSCVAQATVWENLFILLENLFDAIASAINAIAPGAGSAFEGVMDLFLEANSALILGSIALDLEKANDLETASETLISNMGGRATACASIRDEVIPAAQDLINSIDYETASKVK